MNYYYNDNDNEYETYTDKKMKKQIFEKNQEFYKTDTYKRFFL